LRSPLDPLYKTRPAGSVVGEDGQAVEAEVGGDAAGEEEDGFGDVGVFDTKRVG
jgi:hypothetical protein